MQVHDFGYARVQRIIEKEAITSFNVGWSSKWSVFCSLPPSFELDIDKYKISTIVDRKYAPLISRNHMLYEGTHMRDFAMLWKTNLDL